MRLHGLKTLLLLPLLFTVLDAAATPLPSAKAESLYQTSKYQASIEEADRVLEVHPTDTETLNIKALAVSALGNDREAIRLVTQALQVAGNNGQATVLQQAKYWNNLGYFNERRRNPEEALGYYEKSLKMRISVVGEDDLQTADSYNNLGTSLGRLGRYDEAFVNLRKNLELRMRLLGDRDPTVAVALNNLGRVYDLQKNYATALSFYQKALDIDMAAFGPAHPTVAIRWNNIGELYRNMGQYDKAEVLMNKALNSDIATFGEQHPKVLLRYYNLGEIYEAEGDIAKARVAYTKAVKIARQVDPDDVGQIDYIEQKLQALGAESSSAKRG